MEFLRVRARARQAYKLKNIFNAIMQNVMNGFRIKFVGNCISTQCRVHSILELIRARARAHVRFDSKFDLPQLRKILSTDFDKIFGKGFYMPKNELT